MINDKHNPSRRKFMKSSVAIGGLSFFPESVNDIGNMNKTETTRNIENPKSIIGIYGDWANGLVERPAKLSFRNDKWKDIDQWRNIAIQKATELVAAPDADWMPTVSVNKKYEFDGLEIEELSWQIPFGNVTQAILLKPKGVKGKLPGILGLHDHAGMKYFGKRKITKASGEMHPMMIDHQKNYYGGRAWANELAKRGYIVLVHDVFAFGSRRVLFENMKEIPWGYCSTEDKTDKDPEKLENVEIYNAWSSEHEHIMSKSLFCAGTTWPGVCLYDDRCALDVLISRDDVDNDRLGCAGLSGGGLRTVYLGGLDHRVKCAVSVGFMSTWSDFLLNKSYTHTWMTYAPLMPKYLDFPEILGLRVPLPTMTLNNNQDGLFTLPEMNEADNILQEIFDKAGASDKYMGGFYDGDHKFDLQMQNDAFNWFDKWLG